jgi:enoyl-CoA hydratase
MSALRVEVEDGIATVTVDRPERKNAVDADTHTAITYLWDKLAQDESVRAVVLTGTGADFSTGGDSAGFDFNVPEVRARMIAEGRHLFFAMQGFPKPLISAVRGRALGLGATLALLADIVVASETAVFSDSHLLVGLVPGDGGAVLWPSAAGHAKGRYFLLTGERINAAEAEACGLIAKVVPDDQLEETALGLARKLAAVSPAAYAATKKLLNLTIAQDSRSIMDAGLAAEELSMLALVTPS